MAEARTSLVSPTWPWLLVSGIVHALAAWVAVGTLGAGLLLQGRGVEDGDGLGGDSIELEIRGPLDEAPQGSTAGQTAAPPVQETELTEDPTTLSATPVEAPPTERPRSEPVNGTIPVPEQAAPRPEQRQAMLQQLPGRSPTESEGASDGTEETAPGEATPSGTGAEGTTAGAPAGDPGSLILGSAGFGGDRVHARRLLLPNGGACEDPAVGRWRAQKFRASDRTWVRFILRVRRSGGDQLEGTITSRIWSGNAGNPMPGECTPYGFDNEWRMQARGSIVGDNLRFESRNARLVREHCPRSGTTYAPDRFSGTVQPLRGIFRAVNNDGAFDIDEPYTFTRLSCEP